MRRGVDATIDARGRPSLDGRGASRPGTSTSARTPMRRSPARSPGSLGGYELQVLDRRPRRAGVRRASGTPWRRGLRQPVRPAAGAPVDGSTTVRFGVAFTGAGRRHLESRSTRSERRASQRDRVAAVPGRPAGAGLDPDRPEPGTTYQDGDDVLGVRGEAIYLLARDPGPGRAQAAATAPALTGALGRLVREGRPVHSPPARQNPRATRPAVAPRRASTTGSTSDRVRHPQRPPPPDPRRTLTGRGRVTEADVDAAMREVRLALLEADVNFKVVKDFVARVRERAIGAEILAEPDRRPAGREDRPRGADRAALGGRPDVPPRRAARRSSRSSASRARARRRRPRSSPGTSRSWAASRCSSPRTRTARPRRTSSRRSASSWTSRSTAPRQGTKVVDIVTGGHRAREADRPRRRDPRHRRPPHGRRGADGRDPGGRRGHEARRDAARGRRDDRPAGGRGRAGVRGAVPLDRPRAHEDRRRRPRRRRPDHRRGHRASRSSSWAPARRPTRSRCSTRTGCRAGSWAWATS